MIRRTRHVEMKNDKQHTTNHEQMFGVPHFRHGWLSAKEVKAAHWSKLDHWRNGSLALPIYVHYDSYIYTLIRILRLIYLPINA